MRQSAWIERLTQARQHDQSCMLCEHRCAVNRADNELGVCKAGTEARVFRHRIECGEEPELIPCHLFYLSGCDLRCAFCIAEADAFDPRRGQLLTTEFFGEAVQWGQEQGAKTLQWVGGEPTIHLPRILEVMAGCDSLPPVVWKSDFHGTSESFDLLKGLAEFYVADFKFGNDHCARRIASVENYTAIVTRNLRIASKQGRLIVRHLLMPGHYDCCFLPVIRWLSDNLPETAFSLRDGYLPRWRSHAFEELKGRNSREMVNLAKTVTQESGLEVIL